MAERSAPLADLSCDPEQRCWGTRGGCGTWAQSFLINVTAMGWGRKGADGEFHIAPGVGFCASNRSSQSFIQLMQRQAALANHVRYGAEKTYSLASTQAPFSVVLVMCQIRVQGLWLLA